MVPLVFKDTKPHWLLRINGNGREWFPRTISTSNLFIGVVSTVSTEAAAYAEGDRIVSFLNQVFDRKRRV